MSNTSIGYSYVTIDKEKLDAIETYKAKSGKEYYNLQINHMRMKINKQGQNSYINSQVDEDGKSVLLGGARTTMNY